MRKFSLSLAAAAVMVAAFAVAPTGGAAASAKPSTVDPGLLCMNSSETYCMNDKNGTVGTGNIIQIWQSTTGATPDEIFYPVLTGRVGINGDDPFAGSTLNSTYYNAPILQFQYYTDGGTKASGYCLGTTDFGGLALEPCSSGNFFVSPDFYINEPHTIIDVYWTNNQNGGQGVTPQYAEGYAQDGATVSAGLGVQYWLFSSE